VAKKMIMSMGIEIIVIGSKASAASSMQLAATVSNPQSGIQNKQAKHLASMDVFRARSQRTIICQQQYY